jgi:hypothetical protein
MAISGVRSSETVPAVNNDNVGAAVEALSLVASFDDREAVTAQVREEFATLATSGVEGEMYIHVPRSVANLGRAIQALDEGSFGKEYRASYVYGQLWTPGVGQEGYAADELGTLGIDTEDQVHARIAVHSAKSEDEPLLHFLGLPYDDYAKQNWNPKAEATQLEKVADSKQLIEAKHPGLNMAALNANAVAFISLMRRIKGEPMPMEWGFMRDASLGRKTVDGHSVVGRVDSYEGRLEFRNSGGDGYGYAGVGLSVGSSQA